MRTRGFWPSAFLAAAVALDGTPSAAEDERPLTVSLSESRILATHPWGSEFAFSPDSTSLAVVVWKHVGLIRRSLGYRPPPEILVYDLCQEAPTVKIRPPVGEIHDFGGFVRLNEHEKLLFSRWNSTQRNDLEIVDVLTGEVVQLLRNARQPQRTVVAFSADATQVVTWGRDPHGAPKNLQSFVTELTIWDLRTGEKRLVQRRTGGQYWTVAFSRDGTRIAVGGNSEAGKAEVTVFDIPSGQMLWRKQAYTGGSPHHRGHISSLAFAPDGQTFVSGGTFAGLQWWDATTGELLKTVRLTPYKLLWYDLDSASIRTVSYSPDGRVLAVALQRYDRGGFWGSCRILDGVTGDTLAEPIKGNPTPVERVAFSPDGRMLAASSYDGNIRLWDVEVTPVP